MAPKTQQTNAEVAHTLQQQCRQCLEFLQELPNGEGVLYRTTMTVNELGKIDVYQLIFFLAKHAERHLTQIGKAAAEYQDTVDKVV